MADRSQPDNDGDSTDSSSLYCSAVELASEVFKFTSMHLIPKNETNDEEKAETKEEIRAFPLNTENISTMSLWEIKDHAKLIGDRYNVFRSELWDISREAESLILNQLTEIDIYRKFDEVKGEMERLLLTESDTTTNAEESQDRLEAFEKHRANQWNADPCAVVDARMDKIAHDHTSMVRHLYDQHVKDGQMAFVRICKAQENLATDLQETITRLNNTFMGMCKDLAAEQALKAGSKDSQSGENEKENSNEENGGKEST